MTQKNTSVSFICVSRKFTGKRCKTGKRGREKKSGGGGIGRTPLSGDGAQDPLAETNPGAPRRLRIRDGSFAQGSFLSRFNPRRGSDLVDEQFAHPPNMISQAAGHRRGTSSSPMSGFAQLMMRTTEIIGASDQIHPRLKRFETTGRMTRFAGQDRQPFANWSIKALDKRRVEDAAPL